MPVIQVFIISLVGAFLATDRCKLFPVEARNSMNKVNQILTRWISEKTYQRIKIVFFFIILMNFKKNCRWCMYYLDRLSCLQIWPRPSHSRTSSHGT